VSSSSDGSPGSGGLVDLLADQVEALADLRIGEGGDLGFELLVSSIRGWIRRSSRSLESTNLLRKRMAGEV
jgi:hypothetical protein